MCGTPRPAEAEVRLRLRLRQGWAGRARVSKDSPRINWSQNSSASGDSEFGVDGGVTFPTLILQSGGSGHHQEGWLGSRLRLSSEAGPTSMFIAEIRGAPWSSPASSDP